MLTFLVVLPVIIAALLFVLSSNTSVRIFAVIVQAGLFIASIYLVTITRGDNVYITYVGGYEGILGITLLADSLSADFVLITTFIFLVISIYSFKEKKDMPMVWFLLFIMEASMIGLFLSNDLFNIFVLIEVSTVVTLLLVMYDRIKRKLYVGMLFLMANIVAAQFYLFGMGYVYMISGGLDITLVTNEIAGLDSGQLMLPYALIMTSVAFKCTLIPFFSWSPKVRIYPEAPTVVQAILSGLQIKSALYLFIQFQTMFDPIAAQDFFLVIGIISGLFGAFMAICQSDIRLILAYHTISQVGLIIIGVSVGGVYSYVGGLYHIFSHAVFKTTLFLGTGMIIHSYSTADVYKIRGVMKRMPLAGVATAAAVLGIMGAPAFIGSVSKYFIAYDMGPVLTFVAVVISLGTIISFVKFSSVFFGKPNDEHVGDMLVPEMNKTVPSLVLGLMCFAGGIFGTQAIYFLFGQSVSVIMSSYIQKSLIFVGSLVVAYFVYNKVIKGNKLLKRIGGINFSFKTICLSIGGFFASLLIYFAVIAS